MPDVRHLRSRQATPDSSLSAPRLDAAAVAFTVSPTARTMRRQLGPVAWAALEDVLCDLTVDVSGSATAQTSVRLVAAGLGVSKDTAARALARLIDVGLLRRGDSGRADDGTFKAGVYEVLVDQLDGVSIERRPADPIAAAQGVARRSRCRPPEQPALFDLGEAAS